MRLQRILKMGPTEIALRSWQEAFKTVERLTVNSGESRPPGVFTRLQRSAANEEVLRLFRGGRREEAEEALFRHFEEAAPRRFFAGAGDSAVTRLIARRCPEERQRIIESADAVCRGEYDILGYGRLSFGEPMDWHLDPVSGKRSLLVHWSQIDFLDRDQVGDSKVVWELNRHQWLLDLGQAYRFTGEERYAQAFAERIRDWMRNNPVGLGVNWTSSLEVSMRLISWCWALFLFRGSHALTTGLFVDILAWIRVHACYVERYLSYYFSPNTHLTGEALGLYYAGTLLTEFQEAERWASTGRKILLEQLPRQVHEDGVFFEQSTRYQYYTLEFYLQFHLLAERNGDPLPKSADKRIGSMMDFVLGLRRPDGSLPQIGDADGGWLLPLVRRAPEDFTGLFSLAAVLFKRPEYAWAAGTATPELLWLCGSAGMNALDGMHAAPPAPATLQRFPQGGYAIMRSGWDSDAHHLVFDTGPLGCCFAAGHGHADLLSIQCSAWGEPILVDAGSCCYTASEQWRNYFRSTTAHSTVMLDGQGQARPNGPFSWHEKPTARLRRWKDDESMTLLDASHDAWSELPDPVIHRRRIAFVRRGFWVIVDDLSGQAEHQVDLRFQFAPLQVSQQDGGWVRALGRRGRGLVMRTFATGSFHQNVRTGAMEPLLGWISPNYGQRLPAPMLSCSVCDLLPLRLVTLLLPIAEPDQKAPAVEILQEGDQLSGLRIGGDMPATITITDNDIILEDE